MKNFAVFRRKRCLRSDAKRRRRSGDSRQLEKRPSRTIGKNLVGFHPALLKRANRFRKSCCSPPQQERPDYFTRLTPHYSTESKEDLRASCNTDGPASVALYLWMAGN